MPWLKNGPETEISEVVFKHLGVSSHEDINEWFRKSYSGKYEIKNLKEAAQFALKFKNQQVTIVGDYDADGITSTSILYLSLKWAGFKNIKYVIPDRFKDGFGISMSIINCIETGLVITCDNGIAQVEAINVAKEKGLKVIILDHHLPLVKDKNVIYPYADFIIDPNAIDNSSEFKGYCGAGICFKFASELIKDKVQIQKLLSLAAIGTVADVMELKEENYVIVRNGLKRLMNYNTTTSGCYALISAMELTKHITAHDIGFKIGPAINAPSRMSGKGASKVVELLTHEGNFSDAMRMSKKIVEINNERKEAKKQAIEKTYSIIAKEGLYEDNPLVVYVPDIGEGIIGIVAGSLCEKYKVPSIVLTNTTNGTLKGSARSCGNYDMKKELDKCSSLLLGYGGHVGAAGLTLTLENFTAFKRRLRENNTNFKNISSDKIFYDLEIQANEIPATIKELEKYEPFGKGNENIVFKITNFSTIPKDGSYKKVIGTEADIVKFYSCNSIAIGFDMRNRMSIIKKPKSLTLIGTLSNNYFNGTVEHQVEFLDMIENDLTIVVTPLAEKLKTMANIQ